MMPTFYMKESTFISWSVDDMMPTVALSQLQLPTVKLL